MITAWFNETGNRHLGTGRAGGAVVLLFVTPTVQRSRRGPCCWSVTSSVLDHSRPGPRCWLPSTATRSRTIFAQIRSAAVGVYVSSRGSYAYRQRFTKLPIINMASPRSTISSLNLKQTRKKKTDSDSEKKSIFNLIFHHHSRRLAHSTRCVYYFPKGLSSFFPTQTHTTLSTLYARSCICSISTPFCVSRCE